MSNEPYLPITSVAAIDADRAPIGTLAYLVGSNYRHWALFGRDHQDKPVLLDLGGKTPMAIWAHADGLGSAIVVADWRIEVDPVSAISAYCEQIPAGYAFQSGEQIGLVGVCRPAGRPMMLIEKSGLAVLHSNTIHRGAFATWRIVTGTSDRPVTLIDSARIVSAAA